MEFDLVITIGMLIDVTGKPRFRADLGIREGRIAAVSAGVPLTAPHTLDAAEAVVAPGFIDVHSHSDWILPLSDHDRILAPLLLQGITTMVTGNCGFSPAPVTEDSIPLVDGISEMLRDRAFPYRWHSVKEFLDTLEQDGVLLNTAVLVGHGTMRYAAMGGRTGQPTAKEMEDLCDLTHERLSQGAFGLSAGLAYAPGVFARNEELLPLVRAAAEKGGVFTVHGRAYTWVSPFYRPIIVGTPHNIRSIRELVSLAEKAGVRLQLSHQILVGRRTWRTCGTMIREIEQAADRGVDVAFDAFPYTVGNSTVSVVFPEWFLKDFSKLINDPAALRRLRRESTLLRWTVGLGYADLSLLWGCAAELREFEGLSFSEIARRLGRSVFDAYMHVARVSHGKARILLDTYSGYGDQDAPLRTVLSHPLCSFMTDTILTQQGRHNPASFGTFPRILGTYSRDQGLFSLEEAVRRMTSFPSDRIGLKDVGRVAQGLWADLVVFDPKKVADNTRRDRADAPPSGIRAVVLSGKVVVQEGRLVNGTRCGRVLRR